MATILEKEIKEVKRYQDNGKVSESTKITTQTTIKKTTKKDRFMLLYVEAYSHVANMTNVTHRVLAEILKRMVTGDNSVVLDSLYRAEIMESVGITNPQISRALKELCDKGILHKKVHTRKTFRYKLNPYIFGSGSYNDIVRQRLQFNYDFNFENNEHSKKLEITTQYADSDDLEVKEVDLQSLPKNDNK